MQEAAEEEAKHPTAVPNEQEDDGTLEQEVDYDDVEQVLVDLFLFLFLFPYLYLYFSVEEEGVQPAAVPNEQEDDDNEEQVVEELDKDHHSDEELQAGAEPNELEDDYTEVQVQEEPETQAEPCASYEHDVECDGEQGFPESIGHVPSAVQQFGHVEECLMETGPWRMRG
jgi:hypothetical protein